LQTLSFLLNDNTSTEEKKDVRRMCLFLMVEERIIIYTVLRHCSQKIVP
jgi:hypothetical protein